MWGYILGFVRNTEIVKHFNNLAEQKVDQQILYLCKEGNYDIDLDTVLCQWKYAITHQLTDDAHIFNQFLAQIYSCDVLKLMEGTLS